MEITHVCPADSKKAIKTFLRNITRKTDRKFLVIIKNTIQYIQKFLSRARTVQDPQDGQPENILISSGMHCISIRRFPYLSYII